MGSLYCHEPALHCECLWVWLHICKLTCRSALTVGHNAGSIPLCLSRAHVLVLSDLKSQCLLLTNIYFIGHFWFPHCLSFPVFSEQQWYPQFVTQLSTWLFSLPVACPDSFPHDWTPPGLTHCPTQKPALPVLYTFIPAVMGVYYNRAVINCLFFLVKMRWLCPNLYSTADK